MKKISRLLLAALTLSVLVITGCNDDSPTKVIIKPEAPRNVYTVTGDRQVDIFWDHLYKNEIDYYRVFVSTDNNKFDYIGKTNGFSFLDNATEVKNGVKYYYAVTAVGFNGAESDLSKENAYSTPRAEGFGAIVHDYKKYEDGDFGGFSFLTGFELDYLSFDADFFFDYDADMGKFYVNVWNPSSIADMGLTNNINDIAEAPELSSNLWSKSKITTGDYEFFYTEAKVNHTYVIHIYNTNPDYKADNYAKIRITEIGNDKLVFDWAYRDVLGNYELEKRTMANKKRSIGSLKFKRN
ncbi:MAG: hypothetical protein ACEPO8_13735 [Rhodothermaceae bacterium]